MTTTGQLKELVRAKRTAHSPEFGGVFDSTSFVARSALSRAALGRARSFIVNLSDAGDPRGGTHWVAFILPPRQKAGDWPVLYFDSFGAPWDALQNVIPDIHLKFRAWAQAWPAGSRFNAYEVQALDTKTCGLWAAYAAITGCGPNEAFTDLVPRRCRAAWKPFLATEDLKKRDELIQRWAGIHTG